MDHGIGGIKAGGLSPFAERFREEGFAAIACDYRNFGGSGGQPREVLSVSATEHGEAVRREILCDLKTDSFVSPGQGDGFVLHSNLLLHPPYASSRWRSRTYAAHS
jgi:hypothetical protein